MRRQLKSAAMECSIFQFRQRPAQQFKLSSISRRLLNAGEVVITTQNKDQGGYARGQITAVIGSYKEETIDARAIDFANCNHGRADVKRLHYRFDDLHAVVVIGRHSCIRSNDCRPARIDQAQPRTRCFEPEPRPRSEKTTYPRGRRRTRRIIFYSSRRHLFDRSNFGCRSCADYRHIVESS